MSGLRERFRQWKRERADPFTAAASPVHFYCDLDSGFIAPICGSSKSVLEVGPDCPLCGLIADGTDLCPYCEAYHGDGEPEGAS